MRNSMRLLCFGFIFLLSAGCSDGVAKQSKHSVFAELCKDLPTTYSFAQGAFKWDWELIVTCTRKGEVEGLDNEGSDTIK